MNRKRLKEVELTFDKNIEEYFQTIPPSADEAEGDFCVSSKIARSKERITIAI
ncbi:MULTISPECIES: hypothetical protein [Paenibacillus]|uniref:hypothetical protein n=1 Tax=Paenibacillus TaxID=44249 RepID=UPI001B860CF9|nr:hypothetical protein [Paenibacillus anaericanus]